MHPAQIAAWRAESGVPAKPEGYLDNLPHGIVIGADDKPMVGAFVADMHAKHAPPDLVHTAIGSYYKIQDIVHAERAEADFRTK